MDIHPDGPGSIHGSPYIREPPLPPSDVKDANKLVRHCCSSVKAEDAVMDVSGCCMEVLRLGGTISKGRNPFRAVCSV